MNGRFSRQGRAFLATAAILTASGCVSEGGIFEQRVTGASTYPAYSPNTFSAFAAAGPRVTMHGPLPGGATPEEVAAALELPGWWPQTSFRAVDPAEAARQPRIVLAFGVPGSVSASFMCEGDVPTGSITDRLEVGAAYCVGSRPASNAKLTHAEPLTPEDPEFTDAMRQLFTKLAPSRDPHLDDNDGDPCILCD